jgi:hypothetical protein
VAFRFRQDVETQGEGTAPVWPVRNKIDLDTAGRPLGESAEGRAFGFRRAVAMACRS